MDLWDYIQENQFIIEDKDFFILCSQCLTNNNKIFFSEDNIKIFKRYINIDANILLKKLNKYNIEFHTIKNYMNVDIQNYHKPEKNIICLDFNVFKFFFIETLKITNENFLKNLFNSEYIINNYLLYTLKFFIKETKENKIEESSKNKIKDSFNVFYIIKEEFKNEEKFFLNNKNCIDYNEMKNFINSNNFVYIKIINNSSKIIEHIKISFQDYLNSDGSYRFISIKLIDNCLNEFNKIEEDIQLSLKEIKKNKNLIQNNYYSNETYENIIEEINSPEEKLSIPPPPPPLPPILTNKPEQDIPKKISPISIEKKISPISIEKKINVSSNSLLSSLKEKMSQIREKKGYSSEED